MSTTDNATLKRYLEKGYTNPINIKECAYRKNCGSCAHYLYSQSGEYGTAVCTYQKKDKGVNL